ncbi:MAG: imidazolonepropionase [Bacteriovoracaceae bacterium]
MKCYFNINELVTLRKAKTKDGRHLNIDDLDIIKQGAVLFDDKKIHWVGATSEAKDILNRADVEKIDLIGSVVTPEMVDSHTHLVFGGNRAKEYSMRLNGIDYQQIAASGGGINATAVATNKLSAEELFDIGKKRVEQIHSYGVGSIEIKSGYGLNYEKEKELSIVINELKKHFKSRVQIFNTYMCAHAIPAGFKSSQDFINKVVIPLLEDLAKLNIIDAIDIFHEQNYFSTIDSEQLFKKAQELNIKIKTHADEFNDNNGVKLAMDYKALSADHLLKTNLENIKLFKNSATVATLLPGTGYFLGKPQADARAFLDNGAKVAIASDFNPGSCHFDNVLMVASLAAPNYKMNLAELWTSITLNAAHALNYLDQGSIDINLKPRFSIFKTETIDEVTYNWGKNLSHR